MDYVVGDDWRVRCQRCGQVLDPERSTAHNDNVCEHCGFLNTVENNPPLGGHDDLFFGLGY